MPSEARPTSANTAAIVLAAGKGTRMKSDLPKVLHRVCGTPMLERILHILEKAGLTTSCLVISDETLAFEDLLSRQINTTAVIQHRRLGTGDAVASAACAFVGEAVPSYSTATLFTGNMLDHPYVLICAGDTPALDPSGLADFIGQCQTARADLGVIGMVHPEPSGYGRLVLDDQQRLLKIIEEKDADSSVKAIKLCNSGVVFANRSFLFQCLQKLTNNNAQQEYYLTDCFQIAADQGRPALVYQTHQYQSFDGVNRRSQLTAIEQWILQQRRQQLMDEGVSFHLPETCFLEDDVEIGQDSDIGPHCSFTGRTKIGRRCRIGSHCCLHNVAIPDGDVLAPGTIMINA